MSTSDYQDAWAALVTAARKLNEASDGINPIIEGIQTRLKKMNIGVEVEIYVEGDGFSGGRIGFFFGYGRLGKREWGMTCRGAEVDKKPLTEAPREARLVALEHIPALLSALDAEIVKTIADLEAANQKLDAIVAAIPAGLLPERPIGRHRSRRGGPEDWDQDD